MNGGKSIGKPVTVDEAFTDLVARPKHSCGGERISGQQRPHSEPHSEQAGALYEDYCRSGIPHAIRSRTEVYTEGHFRKPSSANSE